MSNRCIEQDIKEKQALKSRFEPWLRPCNHRAIQQSDIQKKLPGTCEWIFSYIAFQKWLQVPVGAAKLNDRILYLSGIPGSGKSVLASSVAQSLLIVPERVFFFSFSATDARRQTADDLAR